MPLDRWFREDLRGYVAATLGARDARVKDHLVPEAVDRLIAEHDAHAATTARRSGPCSRSRSSCGARAGPQEIRGDADIVGYGGAGFLGAHVVSALLEKGHTVVVLDDLSGGFADNVPGRRPSSRAPVTTPPGREALRRARFDYVFHLAAYAAEGLSHFIRRFNYTNNVLGSMTLINEAVRTRCAASSSRPRSRSTAPSRRR